MMARDGFDLSSARSRVRAQKPIEEKVAVADHVIWNDGTTTELCAAADRTLDAICDDLGLARFDAAPGFALKG
jgi:dephospho-CoA kinase